jgi:hypothetical protein
VLVLTALLAGCSAGPGQSVTATTTATTTAHPAATSTSTPPAPTTVPTTTPTTTAPTTTTSTTPPAFNSSVSTVDAADLGGSWHVGCPVDPSQLREIQMPYWGFDGQPHVGNLIVNAAVVEPVIQVFSTLYADRFPLQEMIPQSAYGGDDNAAAAADDTSGFNCRYAVAAGPPQWSMHAYGEAIDVNDVQNPYIDGTTVIPPAGAAYMDRADVRPGMAVVGGTLVEAFASIGWPWGGRWASTPDYQHFSSNGD